jgi:hypothetical protein
VLWESVYNQKSKGLMSEVKKKNAVIQDTINDKRVLQRMGNGWTVTKDA